jgi:hypothetical protein
LKSCMSNYSLINSILISFNSLDTESAKLLSDLRDVRLPAKVEESNFQRYTIEWIGREGLDVEVLLIVLFNPIRH